jgi:ArsR family transcriptional regulator, arsenate/arsenite/antimonite-responsive transcriptional repressor
MCGMIISMIDETTEKAIVFKALADPTRLRILQYLGCCPGAVVDEAGGVRGPSAGEVCCQIVGAEKITSTISHHLHQLREAGLIEIERQGKHMRCALKPGALQRLSTYLLSIQSSGTCDEPQTASIS